MHTTQTIQDLLQLSKPPVAIAFLSTPPANVPPWLSEAVPAGCVFWRKAQEGSAFYTAAADHYNCAVGAYTHKIPLPAERTHELMETLESMVGHQYLTMDEVPGIPTLPTTPGYIAYAPVATATFAPDVVLVTATPAQAMIIYEAALKAGAGDALTHALGRPACALLPLTVNGQRAAISLGCKGNRTFTGLADGEMYVAIPGAHWPRVTEKLVEAYQANVAMGTLYANKQAQFAD